MKQALSILVFFSSLAVCTYGAEIHDSSSPQIQDANDPSELDNGFKELLKAAERKDAAAETLLGWMYDNGDGGIEDLTAAVKWYRKLADQGEADAQALLGVMYYKGYGVSQDHIEAVKWYRKAADQGEAMAQINLCKMYYNGYGVDKDYIHAYKWALLARINGDYNDQVIRFLEANMTAKQMAESRRLANEHLDQKKLEKKDHTPDMSSISSMSPQNNR